MANRVVAPLTSGVMVLALISCSGAETPEQCVERLMKAFPDPNFFDSGPWRSTVTYRLSDDTILPQLQRDAASNSSSEGPTFTYAMGPGRAAFDQFSEQDVPDNGAYLSWNDRAYFRTPGLVGSPKDSIAAGCFEGPTGSQLISVDFAPLRQERPAGGQAS